MSETKTGGGIASTEDLLAHALAMEIEAEDRYRELAGQMEVHNNPEVAALFQKLAEIEGRHAEQIRERTAEMNLPRISPWDFAWDTGPSPEAEAGGGAHYLMTPHHALQIALRNEEAARDFFRRLAEEARTEEVKRLAEEFAEDEAEHVDLVRQWLAKFPAPEEGWDEDPDPPLNVD